MLWCLYILHIYWFILMQKILFTFFKKGVAEDTVNQNKSSKQLAMQLEKGKRGSTNTIKKVQSKKD